jgi:hypothetical protein
VFLDGAAITEDVVLVIEFEVYGEPALNEACTFPPLQKLASAIAG